MLFRAFHQLVHERINLGPRHVGHDHHVRNIFFTRQLPALDECVIHGPFQHDRGTQVVQSARQALFRQLVAQVPRRFHAVHDIAFNARNALFAQTVPQIQGRLAVAGTHNGRIDRIQVSNVLFDILDVFLARECNAAGHGTSQHFVTAHGNRVNGFAKADFRSKVDKGHHEGKECTVAVNVVTFARNIKLFQHAQDAIEIVHGTLDGSTNIDIENDGFVEIFANRVGQNVVINFPHGQCRNGFAVHSVVASSLKDGVMCLLTGIENAVGKGLTRQEKAVQVSFGSTRRDIALLFFDFVVVVGKIVINR
jgi:hypothetical protein